jgi:carboxyl-terminal processing protease
MKAIQSVAPVGIGGELRMQDGVAVINRLMPGTPAELGGQLQPGDRIVAVAQGNNSFVDARGMALADLVQAIRGAPGTLLQLQVLSADPPPDATLRTVAIFRGQIKFKR